MGASPFLPAAQIATNSFNHRVRMRGALLLVPLLGTASALPQGGFLSGIGNAFNNFFGGNDQGARPPPRQAQRPRPQPLRFQQQQFQPQQQFQQQPQQQFQPQPQQQFQQQQQFQPLQGWWEAPASVEPQPRTISGLTPGTTFSAATWPPGRLAAPRSSSTRPRRTASRWAWSRCPWTLPPSRTTSTG